MLEKYRPEACIHLHLCIHLCRTTRVERLNGTCLRAAFTVRLWVRSPTGSIGFVLFMRWTRIMFWLNPVKSHEEKSKFFRCPICGFGYNNYDFFLCRQWYWLLAIYVMIDRFVCAHWCSWWFARHFPIPEKIGHRHRRPYNQTHGTNHTLSLRKKNAEILWQQWKI